MKKRWKVNQADRETASRLADELGVKPLTAQLLINRGLADSGRAYSFLSPSLADLRDPFLMKGMDRAVERIARAVMASEPVAVWGDYDVDGTTGAALLKLFFRELGLEVVCHIPDRRAEGYGLNTAGVRALYSSGVRLIITVDCGSSNRGEVGYANSLGVDVIVTDHHEVPAEPPPALAMLNPRQEGCPYPFKGLSGVGVAFKLVMALRARLRSTGFFAGAEPNLKRYLDLVCIGTIADMVPLVDENRVLVRWGLAEINASPRPGIASLKESAGLKRECDASAVAFHLAPRLNAAGRLSTAETSLKLLTTGDQAEAASLAMRLERENSSRQGIEAATLKEAAAMLGGATADRAIVLSSDGWHPGVIGIVASRLIEMFSRPAVLIALDNGVGKGSARGVRSFDMLGALDACSTFLERYGGHKAAAGLTIAAGRIEEFRDAFIRHANAALTDDDLVPEIVLDAVVSLNDVDLRLVSEIGSLSPFGQANKEPVLGLMGASITGSEVVGARHVKFSVMQDAVSYPGIGFGLAGLHPVSGDGLAVAFSPFVDEWRGKSSLRLRVRDVQERATAEWVQMA
jgi:single-stranded-DNA-specific exonuclease